MIIEKKAVTTLDYPTNADASLEYSHQNGYLYYSQNLQTAIQMTPTINSDKAIWQYNTATSHEELIMNEYGNIRRGKGQDKKMYIAQQGAKTLAFVDEHLANVFYYRNPNNT